MVTSPSLGSPVVVEDEVDLVHGDLGDGGVLGPGGGAAHSDAARAHPGARDQREAALGVTTGLQQVYFRFCLFDEIYVLRKF